MPTQFRSLVQFRQQVLALPLIVHGNWFDIESSDPFSNAFFRQTLPGAIQG